MRPLTVCSGIPPEWPAEIGERFAASLRQHWPASADLVVEPLSQGGSLDRHRLIVPAAVADDLPNDAILAWLDPDIETLSAVPSFVVPQLMADADLCFIGSGEATELGFWAVRLSPAVRTFLMRLGAAALADSSAADAWSSVRAQTALRERDLTPGRFGGEWACGPLGRYTHRIPVPGRV